LRDDYSFVAVLQQNVLEDLLESALERRGIEIEWNHHLVSLEPSDDGVIATIDRLERSSFGYAVAHMEWVVAKTRRIEVPFVIGADGHLSLVRSALSVEFRNYRAPRHFAVFEFKTDAELEHEMRLVFHDDTTNVVWPLPDGYCRWSFELSEFEALLAPREKDRLEFEVGKARYPILAPEHLHELLRERAPWFQGGVDDLRWRTVVRFDTRLATSFGRNRMWLAGDAAHMTGPAGIQSMNVGLVEANDLAGRLAAVIRGRADMSSLAEYEREHMANWRFLLGMLGTFDPGPNAEPWVERCVERLLPSLPASGEDLVALARQIGIEANVPAGTAVAG
ncbi:MAG TPA: NAD(P)/FAD-dependent oxidoreductase, partial [Rhodothermales bacterium]